MPIPRPPQVTVPPAVAGHEVAREISDGAVADAVGATVPRVSEPSMHYVVRVGSVSVLLTSLVVGLLAVALGLGVAAGWSALAEVGGGWLLVGVGRLWPSSGFWTGWGWGERLVWGVGVSVGLAVGVTVLVWCYNGAAVVTGGLRLRVRS
jgi:hypothetical protein